MAQCLRTAGLIAIFCSVSAADTISAANAKSPNIVLILADDLGYSDIGSYGGEIRTPNLDALASRGLRYTDFYNTGRCWPTRASLLTGYYAQQVRMDPPTGRLPPWAHVLAHPLKQLGYRTYHSGKWHLSGAPRPVTDGGFDHSYQVKLPVRYFAPVFTQLDGTPLQDGLNNADYYVTTAIMDHALSFIDESLEQPDPEPFFLYLAFTAPHFPLQALPKDIQRYDSTYSIGWDQVRGNRAERLRSIGLYEGRLAPKERTVKPPWNLTANELQQKIGTDEVGDAVNWTELQPHQARLQARKMSIHAAMVDRMDQEIGRLVAKLSARGVLDDTVIMFLSDNGASAEQLVRGEGHDRTAVPGSANTFLSLGPGWSTAANAPFRRHKYWTYEGGIATPLIVHWPNGISDRGGIRRFVGHAIDIPRTIVELAGGSADYLRATKSAPTPPGLSLVPSFSSDEEAGHEYLFFHHHGNRALRAGNRKIVSSEEDRGDWQLYDLSIDRAERNDLAIKDPEVAESLALKWRELETKFHKHSNVE